jgi:hypothetical protein
MSPTFWMITITGLKNVTTQKIKAIQILVEPQETTDKYDFTMGVLYVNHNILMPNETTECVKDVVLEDIQEQFLYTIMYYFTMGYTPQFIMAKDHKGKKHKIKVPYNNSFKLQMTERRKMLIKIVSIFKTKH